MCPPCMQFFIGLDHPPSCLTLPFEKKIVRMEVLQKKIALIPPTFLFKFVLNPPQPPPPPWQKKSNWP